MVRELKGDLDGAELRIAIVVARFNEHVTSLLLQGALDGLAGHGVRDRDVTVAWVPGAFEIPIAAKALARQDGLDAIVCVGAVIRHETDHYRYVAGEAARGIADVSRETGVPVMFGILMTDTDEQALARAGGAEGNKGHDSALAAIEMANLLRNMRGE